jgi:leucine dehydrogenase
MQITEIPTSTHERVLRVADRDADLIGFIALHSTGRGPAAGGLRMRPYDSEAAALADVLGLSRGMSYKTAAADLPLGGGKSVIIGDPAHKSEAQLRAMAAAVDSLGGAYWTAEDMGMSPEDMAVMRTVTPYVAGLADGPFASGDPSPVTARGIFYAIRTTAERVFGSRVLEGRRIAVQGVGHVGWQLCKLLRAAGADLVVADTDAARAAKTAETFGADIVAPGDILTVEADILAPCAVGGLLTEDSVAALRVRAVCGGANTQLASDAAGDALHARGILFAPDYVANAGGIVNVATEIRRIADRRGFVTDKLAALEASLAAIFDRAEAERTGPHRVADRTVAPLLASRTAA